jgi:hypothetical protein
MKRLPFGTVLLALLLAFPMITMAQVNVRLDIAMPSPIAFAGPPVLVVIPGTYIYVVPDVSEDLYFYNGWWWRFWNGRWYRSRYYDSGWIYYDRVPVFYQRVPTGWRNYYHEHRWEGREWNYQRIPYEHLQHNWSGWQKSKYWEYQQSWGVRGFQPHPASQNLQPAPPPDKSFNRDIRPPHEIKPISGPPPSNEAKVLKRPEREIEAQRTRELQREKQFTGIDKPGPGSKEIKIQKKYEKEGEPIRPRPVYREPPPAHSVKVEHREIKETRVVKPPPKPIPPEVKNPEKHKVEDKR